MEECQEFWGEQISEQLRVHRSVADCDEPMEEICQESLNKLSPYTTENFDNEPAVEAVKERLESTGSAALMDAAVEIYMRDTASIDEYKEMLKLDTTKV